MQTGLELLCLQAQSEHCEIVVKSITEHRNKQVQRVRHALCVLIGMEFAYKSLWWPTSCLTSRNKMDQYSTSVPIKKNPKKNENMTVLNYNYYNKCSHLS